MRLLVVLLLNISFIFAVICPTAQAAPMRIVYGFDREFPPFSFENPGGQAIGFEVELIEAIFAEADVTLIKRPLQWELVPLELSSGTITLTTGMVKTPQRERLFLFSDAVAYPMQIRLFTKIYKRSPSLRMFRGQTVAVEDGSFQHRLLEQYGEMNIKPYEDKGSALRDLYNDAVAAYCGPVPNTYYNLHKLNYDAITTVGSPLAIVHSRIAVNRNRGDILHLVNTGFTRILENGEYDRIYRKWFVRELSNEEKEIILQSAVQGGIPAYAPYTDVPQGAAILTATGKVFTGCTIENADSSLTTTAIQNALANAISEGEFEIIAAAITNDAGILIRPSDKDLQAVYEFSPATLVLERDEKERLITTMVRSLLPTPVSQEIIPITK